jgi:hypothetical protein
MLGNKTKRMRRIIHEGKENTDYEYKQKRMEEDDEKIMNRMRRRRKREWRAHIGKK